MGARAEAVAGTRQRILEAVRDIAYERFDFDPTLAAVAERAGVSVQTVLRHFSSREALLIAAAEAALGAVAEERRPTAPDIDSAISTLIEHYELRGDFALALVANEARDPQIAAIAESGKQEHRRWVAAVFTDRLPAAEAAREELLDLLVVATDVFAWKLLRRDRGHDVPTVHARMRTMTTALLASPSTPIEGAP